MPRSTVYPSTLPPPAQRRLSVFTPPHPRRPQAPRPAGDQAAQAAVAARRQQLLDSLFPAPLVRRRPDPLAAKAARTLRSVRNFFAGLPE